MLVHPALDAVLLVINTHNLTGMSITVSVHERMELPAVRAAYTDFKRELGLQVNRLAAVFLSHKHADHILGLPKILDCRDQHAPPLLVGCPCQPVLCMALALSFIWHTTFLHKAPCCWMHLAASAKLAKSLLGIVCCIMQVVGPAAADKWLSGIYTGARKKSVFRFIPCSVVANSTAWDVTGLKGRLGKQYLANRLHEACSDPK